MPSRSARSFATSTQSPRLNGSADNRAQGPWPTEKHDVTLSFSCNTQEVAMDRAAIDRLEQQVDDEVKKRFPGAVQRVAVLQYGDDPVIEPGELLVRVIIEAPEEREGQQEALQAFEHTHGPAIKQFRKDLSAQLPEAGRLEFRTSRDTGQGPRMVLGGRPRGSLEARAAEGGELTPVMARLGPADAGTLDALLTAGIAPSRAEGDRWAPAPIRERPAYAQLRERARESARLQ